MTVADDIRAAMDRIRSEPYRSPSHESPPVMHPDAYKACQDAGLITADGRLDWDAITEVFWHEGDPVVDVATWDAIDGRTTPPTPVTLARHRRASGFEWFTTVPRKDTPRCPSL